MFFPPLRISFILSLPITIRTFIVDHCSNTILIQSHRDTSNSYDTANYTDNIPFRPLKTKYLPYQKKMAVYYTIRKTFLPTFLTMLLSTVLLPFLPARSKRFNLKSIIITIIILCFSVQSWNTTMNDNLLPLVPLPHRVFRLNPDQYYSTIKFYFKI